MPERMSSISAYNEAIWPELDRKQYRYCQLCRREIARTEANRAGRHWLCACCRQRLTEEAPDSDLGELVSDVVRRRWRSRR